MADLLLAGNGRTRSSPASRPRATPSGWPGQQCGQYQVSTGGAIRIGRGQRSLFGSTVALEKMRTIMRSARSAHLLEQDHAGGGSTLDRRRGAARAPTCRPPTIALFGTPPVLRHLRRSADPLLQYENPLTGSKAMNALAQQMQIVARTIEREHQARGVKRQVFFVSLGGFDTHESQNRNHADLMARLGHAFRYFDSTLASLGAVATSDDLHGVRLRTHFRQQRRRYRPRLGRAPFRDGRGGARAATVRRVPAFGFRRWQRRFHEPGPDPQRRDAALGLRRSVRRHARPLVRTR